MINYFLQKKYMSLSLNNISLDDEHLFERTAIKDEKIDFKIIKKERQDRLDRINIKYKLIYNNCIAKIKNAIKNKEIDTFYAVPSVYKEYPDYSCKDCLGYIEERLVKQEFEVYKYDNNKIFITFPKKLYE